MRDNPGKLGLIPHRHGILKWAHVQSSGALGWVRGRLGSWRGNCPPSLRSVWAMRVVAQRWGLRHGPRPYGAQQARKLRNGRKPDGGIPSARTLYGLFGSVNGFWNKGWARLVPAAAVTPAALVVSALIGSKAPVAGLESPWLNLTAQPSGCRGYF